MYSAYTLQHAVYSRTITTGWKFKYTPYALTVHSLWLWYVYIYATNIQFTLSVIDTDSVELIMSILHIDNLDAMLPNPLNFDIHHYPIDI